MFTSPLRGAKGANYIQDNRLWGIGDLRHGWHQFCPDVAWSQVGAFLVGAAVLLTIGVIHLRRAANPMLAISMLRLKTFSVTFYGGSLFRMSIGALLFLLPLLFQLGYGFDPFHAGLLIVAAFAGNLVMKPFTTTVLRRFGFRTTLIGNGLLNAIMIAVYALAIRLSEWLVPRIGLSNLPAASYRMAFILVAVVALLGVLDCLGLKPDAGDNIARPGKSLQPAPAAR